jgi:anti-anti-sigma regulatory factor
MRMKAGQSPKVVNLQGSLLVDRAAALKDELVEALEGSDNVLLGISQVEDLDLACLQVLYAAKKSATSAGKELHFLGSVPSRLSKRLAACGFLGGASGNAEEFESALLGF